MRIRHVSVSQFRGIKKLDWHVSGRVVCLVGPGDSTKTTILDAIELALAPKWYIPFTDSDFYHIETDKPITIEVTVGELIDELLDDDRCGLYLRGYRSDEPILDDPEDDSEAVVTVRLQVTEDLEPKWELVKGGTLDPKLVSWRDRERLAMARLGDDVERHMTWSRGSALARITEKDTPTGPTLALANRAANAAIAGTSHDDLESAAKKAQEAARQFGVTTPALRPGLDAQSLSFGTGALALHDESLIPLRSSGLGTRRLTTLAIQQIGLGTEAILLIDEVEHGLEPHRIRRLLKKLTGDRTTSGEGTSEAAHGQVLMTTHSPTAIMALPVGNLGFVKSVEGETTVELVADDAEEAVQAIVRTISHAVLARKILVCEGKTEEALCRVMDDQWAASHEGNTFACNGVVPVNGGGSAAPSTASEFRRLGYDVAFLGDSDVPISPTQEALETEGVTVVLWADNLSIEERITADLPWDSLQSFLETAIDERGENSVLSSVSHHLGHNVVSLGASLDTWISDSVTEDQIRTAIGRAAKSKGSAWFKDLNTGERLARIVAAALPQIPESELAKGLDSVEGWAYA